MGKHTLTRAYMLYLAHWARKLSWQETARSFYTTWEKVYQAVDYVVQWGLAHRQLGPIRAIGVDEIQYGRGHTYLTLVYQIEAGCVRLLWVGKDRTLENFEKFFTLIGKELAGKVRAAGKPGWPVRWATTPPARPVRVVRSHITAAGRNEAGARLR